jgi:hypothetical protein
MQRATCYDSSTLHVHEGSTRIAMALRTGDMEARATGGYSSTGHEVTLQILALDGGMIYGLEHHSYRLDSSITVACMRVTLRPPLFLRGGVTLMQRTVGCTALH